MDIAYYISDLLGQQGELTVPNLGYFVQIRMAAYYDNQAKRFFPPHYSVQFDPQTIDEDDSLANYITGIKNISVASAKYFIEKYIANLKSQAVVEDVPFANLGTFSSDGLKLTFSSGTKLDDPAFFAFQPLEVYKIGEAKTKKPAGKSDFLTEAPPPVPVAAAPVQPMVAAAPAYAPTPVIPEPVVANDETEEYEEDEPRRVFGIWMILLIVLVLIVAGLGALYKFKPDVFNKIIPLHKKDTTTIVKSAAPIVNHSQDSLAKVHTDSIAAVATAKRDSAAKADSAKTKVKPEAKPEVKQPEVKPEVKKPEEKKPVVVPQKKKPEPVVVKPPVTTQPVTANIGTGEMPAEIPRGWYVITRVRSPHKKACEDIISDLKSKGIPARFATLNVSQFGNYLVIVAAAPTEREVRDKMKELKATGKITDSEMSIMKY